MQGNQIVALLIGILLLIVSIGWLIFCWYRRHVHMGVMISQARARVLRERQHANYDVERGYHDSEHLVPKYTRGGWARRKPRYAGGPKAPEFVVLRRLDGSGGLDYRTRSFRHARLSPIAESQRPVSQRENEQPQMPQEEKSPEHAQEQPQQKLSKRQKKKQKQKKGNHGNQENQNNQGHQNNRGSHDNQGHQNSPPKGKKDKRGKNKGHQEEPAPWPQEDRQHDNPPDNQGSWEAPNDYHGQQDGHSNGPNGSWHSPSYRGNSNHGGQTSWRNGSSWSDQHDRSPPVSDKNGKRGSNRGSQTGNSQNGNGFDRRSQGQGSVWHNGHQHETFSQGYSDRGSRAQEQPPADAPW